MKIAKKARAMVILTFMFAALTFAQAQHGVFISWSAPSVPSGGAAIAGYNVFRSSDGGATWTKINSATVTAVNYLDVAAGLKTSTTYDYQVETVDVNGNSSAPSNTSIDVTPPAWAVNPNPPSGCAVKNQ